MLYIAAVGGLQCGKGSYPTRAQGVKQSVVPAVSTNIARSEDARTTWSVGEIKL